jgi:hypothetical protein
MMHRIVLIALSVLKLTIADNTRFPTCTGVPTNHPTEDISPTFNPTLWPTPAPFTLWPTGAPQPTSITNFPTTTYYPSFTPAPSPTVSPSTALPTPSYANKVSPPSEAPTSVPTAAPTAIYWILGASGNTCDDVCTGTTQGGVCRPHAFNAITSIEAFSTAFESSLFRGNCIYPGILYYNASVNATKFCGYAFNFVFDPIVYHYPAAKVVESINKGSDGNTIYGYDIICGFGKNATLAAQGRCNQVPNDNVLRLCPCSKPCYAV